LGRALKVGSLFAGEAFWQMSKRSTKHGVTDMVRDVLGPEMKAAGFRRNGRTFWRDGPEVCHVAVVAMSRWGSSEKSSFDVQLGVFWHRVEKFLKNPSVGRMPPPEYRCTFRIDLGRTISMPPKRSWEVTGASNFDALGREVLKDLREYGLPWFEYRSDLKRALEWKRYARRESDGNYSVQELISADARVVLRAMLGKTAGATARLRHFVESCHAKSAAKSAPRLKIDRTKVVVKRRGARDG
jgi:hypothetical protein